MTGSWTQSFCSSVRIQILGLSGYPLQFWSYSFNILQDVYTHNGGVHVHRILMVSRGHHLFLKNHFQQNNFVHNYQVRGHTSFLVYNLQSRAPTHAVLVIGLYELLGNPTSSYNVYYIDTALLVALQCNETFQKGSCFSLSEAR